MFNEIDFNIKCAEGCISTIRKMNKVIIGVLLFTSAVLMWNGYLMYTGVHLDSISLISDGMMIGNIVWFLCELFRNYAEIDSETHSMELYKKMQREEVFIRALENMRGAEMQMTGVSNYYQELMRKSNASYPENKPQE